jgi:cell division protein FtsI/penicillin-binding protein 2
MTVGKAQPGSSTRRADGLWAHRRGLFLAGFLALWLVGLVARLYQLEVISYAELLSRAQKQQQRTVEVAPQRGTIYDRKMQPLAMSLAVDSVYAVPAEMTDRDMEAKMLAPVLGLDGEDLEGQFKTFKSFCWVKRKVTTEEAERVRGLDLKGIYFQKEMKRFYPKGSLAAQVLGYVGMDDKGLAGLEYSFDKQIRGTPGRVLVDTDARRQTFHSTEWQGAPGDNVVLTVDENIQYAAEKALDEAVKKWKAADGIAIVQNPNTGEILAMASSPTFDPNHFAKSKPQDWINRAVGWVYEPGSTFKIVTVSAAIEEGLARPTDVIDCQMGSIVLAGHTIHDHKPFGDLTVEQVLVHSSDVGAIKLGLRLGSDRLYRYIRRFGFGSDTDIRLPGEERGLLKPPDRWSGISVGEMSMGQEVGVTPLQMVSAYSAIANGGILYQPRIVRDVYRGEQHVAAPAPVGRRVVSERTAQTMRELFEKVVEEGTGTPARLAGYTAGGKTGTAQKIDASGTYSKTHYIASFIGFAPVSQPAVTILVVIDSPVGAIYGTEVAAPAFKSIAEQTLGYLNVPQDNPSWWPQLASSSVRSSRQKREVRTVTPPLDFEPPRAAPSAVQDVSYRLPTSQTARDTVVLNDGPLTAVPNFTGLSVRKAAEECQELGLDLSVQGSGLAVQQNPPAGTQVAPGTRVWLKFAR